MAMTDAEKMAQWKRDNPEKVREQGIRYRVRLKDSGKKRPKQDPVKAKERTDRWKASHPDEWREHQARYREGHREQLSAANSAYHLAHPEVSRNNEHRRRTRKRGGEVEVFMDVEIFERDEWTCQICFEQIDPILKNRHPRMASLDHVQPISKGGNHTRANTQASHLQCNLRKGASL